jgi:hypothetical protein
MNLKVRMAAWALRRKIVASSGLKGREKKMLERLLKQWQTTIMGSSAGGAIATGMGWTTCVASATPGAPDVCSINWWAVLSFLLLTAYGIVTKQWNTTGGTIPLTHEAEKRVTAAASAPPTK